MNFIAIFLVALFLLGIIVGSFIAGRTQRIMHEVPTDPMGRSYCFSCKRTLSWWQMIPIISQILLRRKCAYCKTPFSLFYMAVEASLGCIFLVSGLCFHFLITPLDQLTFLTLGVLCFQLLILSILFYASVLDLGIQAFPIAGILFVTALTVLARFLGFGYIEGIHGILGSIGFAGTLFAIQQVGKFILKKDVMGTGDICIALLLGASLGISGAIISFYITMIMGAILSCMLLISKKVSRHSPLAFAPLLSLGGWITMYGGKFILDWYLSLLS